MEWLVTNGLGGYASGTVAGVATRRYHGLLVAALPGAQGRMMMLNHLSEQVRQFILLSPARAWTAQDVASRLALSVPTLRRRLREESQSFRQIVRGRVQCAKKIAANSQELAFGHHESTDLHSSRRRPKRASG